MEDGMAATARVVVLMSPKEKAALVAKAARFGRIPAGELVRRAIAAYDPATSAEAEELRALLATFRAGHTEALAQLEHTERRLDDALAWLETH
jgi:hypothetical protein